MENQRNLFVITLLAISAILYFKWLDFVKPEEVVQTPEQLEQSIESSHGVPSTPDAFKPFVENQNNTNQQNEENKNIPIQAQFITVETDLVIAVINNKGGVIERVELKKEAISIDKPEQGYPLLKNEKDEIFIVENGLTEKEPGSSHDILIYQTESEQYNLNGGDQVVVPLVWVSANGERYTKTITFKRDSYIVDIDYQIQNNSNKVFSKYLYAQFKRTEPVKTGGSFAQLPSYVGAVYYEEDKKDEKYSFGDMFDDDLNLSVNKGWVAMIQHYFVAAFLPSEGDRNYYSRVTKKDNPIYRFGYQTSSPTVIQPGQSGSVSTKVFIGPKEQRRLDKIENELAGAKGLSLTVDFGVFTALSKPLFWVLDFFYKLIGNWGWSIVLTTLLIKLVFFPLSAKSYKSMAAMKKIQPRMKTLKERYKDDRPKFQQEMMALYKKEKVNPAGGCLPILIQIPVFLAFYWALLESVEMRHAPFTLWLQDLSAPDPYYVLPILMGLTQFLMTKLNPAPMDDIQKKVMMFMPLVLTFIFLSFPQGLVLYWVVNNILTMAQQWYINRKYA